MTGACAGKVALVTGASRGLGKAIAVRLAAEGATVGLTARTMEPDPKYVGSLRQTLEEITAAGGSVQKVELLLTGADATVKKLRKEDIAELRAAQQQK